MAISRRGVRPGDEASNCSVLYKDWREQQTLLLDHYGQDGVGSWVLLEGRVASAAPVMGYRHRKYLVGGEWRSLKDLHFHGVDELKVARDAAKSARSIRCLPS